MFEAIHGSAPRRAGQDVANPSGLLLGAVLMLVHIGQGDVAEKVQNAWLRTIEDGIHTYDVFDESVSTEKVGTSGFADAVIARVGQKPETLKPASYSAGEAFAAPTARPVPQVEKTLDGVDVFVQWRGSDPNELGAILEPLAGDEFELVMISNRGQKVWPGGFPETYTTDHWRCRYMSKGSADNASIVSLLSRVHEAAVDFVMIECLYEFEGERGYTLGQGQ